MESKTNNDDFNKQIHLRPLKAEDFEAIIAMQKQCFPHMTPWTYNEFFSQIVTFPQGQIGVEYGGQLIGSSSSLIVEFDEYGNKHTYDEIAAEGYIDNHDSEGDTLYGIEVMVHPDYQGMRIGRRLYEARKELTRQLNLKRIIIGGRMPNYKNYKDRLTIYEYVDEVFKKNIYDPILTFQLSNGFTIKRILPDYLPEDQLSQGYAILLEWMNLHYQPKRPYRMLPSLPVRICVIQYQMRRITSFDEFAELCEYFVDVASGYKSDFAVFPEIFTLQLLSSLPDARPAKAVRRLAEFTPQYLDLFYSLSVKYNINIIGGSHFAFEDDNLYNIAYLFKRDGTIEKQYKLHITPNERHWWGVQPGKHFNVFDTDKGKISIQICYDVEFPELSRIAAEKGANILFVPFCTDERQGYLRVRYCAQARAIENQMYAALAGNVGNLPFVENIDINYAQSGIYTPSDFGFSRDGVAGECSPNTETVVVADVDLEVLKRHRKRGTVLNLQDRRLDLYQIVDKNPQ
ncbi:MAG: GNAT family N-acetyltransferase [Caldithrix sp.]|nr:GNAT family N-acetyltransferase [Caldithrix sp.]